MDIRGLRNFINETYELGANAPERIADEITKIKKAFMSKKKKSYEKKKSIAKLCYITLYGYDIIQLGIGNIIDLIESSNIANKRIGWIAASILCNTHPEQIIEFGSVLKKQLSHTKNEPAIDLALGFIANCATSKIADTIGPSVVDILISNTISEHTKSRALIALYQIYQSSLQVPGIDRVSPRVVQMIQSTNLSFALAASLLAFNIVQLQPATSDDIFQACITVLHQLVVQNKCPSQYTRYGVPCPFLCANLFRILNFYLTYTNQDIEKLDQIANSLLMMNNAKRDPDGLYAFLTVFSEASIFLVQVPLPQATLENFITVLIKHTRQRRHFAMDSLANLVGNSPHFASNLQTLIPELLSIVTSRVYPTDMKAFTLLYFIANNDNCMIILDTLIPFVSRSPLHLRAELCKKLAVLANSFSKDSEWKSQTLFKLVECSDSDDCSFWQHVAKSILDDHQNIDDNVQNLITKIEENPGVNGSIIKIASYVFGQTNLRDAKHVVDILMTAFSTAPSSSAQTSIVSGLLKISAKYKEVTPDVLYFLQDVVSSSSFEVSQRSREALAVLNYPDLSVSMLSAPDSYVDTSIIMEEKPQISVSDHLDKFLKENMGIVHYQTNITVLCGVEKTETSSKILLTIKIQNHDTNPLKIDQFQIECESSLLYKKGSEVNTIESDATGVCQIYFVANEPFYNPPIATIIFDSKQTIKFKLPVLPRFFITAYNLSRDSFTSMWQQTMVEKQATSSILILPDGDILSEIVKTAKKWFNLTPLDCCDMKNVIFMAGTFHTFTGNAGILIRFTFQEEEMILTMDLHTTSAKATDAILECAHLAFPFCDFNTD
ncbi:Adaptin N terminal region family protein [Trichomonas vaginalis G3]|uniref:Adaptin N terminal region family protein n=1 Tax=Trichomonas vaginalis (strain ATCC PRA-98 / G3) TaxID=412133 RepID=A2F9H6_TRIV3|nr:clathrin adaptor protein [Trichomonas vaginalis G3]EAX98447.1 Adaptin N terminal region family protein [Trichomonas vaginalis G3]KAI5493719.1 clathrin adaptor protein [Trichomonas vaginalis G3]|eukprot:XP_001311377.1 Adaptin N terminal region family protein [Trichomonas vaginalis G3]